MTQDSWELQCSIIQSSSPLLQMGTGARDPEGCVGVAQQHSQIRSCPAARVSPQLSGDTALPVVQCVCVTCTVSPVPCWAPSSPLFQGSCPAVLLSLCPVLTSAAFPGFVCPWEPNPGTELPAHLTQTHLFVSTMLLSVFGSAETHRSGMDPPHVNVCCSPYFSISFYPGGTNAAGDIMVFNAGVLSVLATLVQRIFSFPLVLL